VEEIFIAGLLHDIGKLILRQRLGDVLEEVAAEAETARQSYLEVEQRRLGFTHADLGAAVLERWRLPQELVEAVRQHHASKFELGDAPDAPIHAVVNFGDELAKTIGAGYDNRQYAPLERLPLARHYEIGLEAVGEFEEELKDSFAEERRLYEEA
jgi:putative nucleotidyltransferase with HDIG domain